jgi:hypothetical protein
MTLMGRSKQSDRYVSQCHFVPHKSHPGSNAGLSVTTNRLSLCAARNVLDEQEWNTGGASPPVTGALASSCQTRQERQWGLTKGYRGPGGSVLCNRLAQGGHCVEELQGKILVSVRVGAGRAAQSPLSAVHSSVVIAPLFSTS